MSDFNTNIFPPETDINFERDFGQWFTADDVLPLDMFRAAHYVRLSGTLLSPFIKIPQKLRPHFGNLAALWLDGWYLAACYSSSMSFWPRCDYFHLHWRPVLTYPTRIIPTRITFILNISLHYALILLFLHFSSRNRNIEFLSSPCVRSLCWARMSSRPARWSSVSRMQTISNMPCPFNPGIVQPCLTRWSCEKKLDCYHAGATGQLRRCMATTNDQRGGEFPLLREKTRSVVLFDWSMMVNSARV